MFVDVYGLGEATDNCVPTPRVHHTNSSTSYSICPQKEWLVVLLLALYLIITVVVLLNLLIAIFKLVQTNIEITYVVQQQMFGYARKSYLHAYWHIPTLRFS
jgi:hypothetical protein